MNFQTVEQANGQLVSMWGMITEFKGEGVNENSGKPYKKVVVQDITGKKHNVTLRGDLPGVELLNQKAAFNLSTFQGTYKNQPYIGFSGFWDNRVAVQDAPQVPSKVDAQPTGATSADKEVDWDAKDLRMARMNALKNATELICILATVTEGASEIGEVEVKRVAELFVNYIYNGLPTGFDQFDKENPIEEDNKPVPDF